MQPNIKDLRNKTGLSQSKFAEQYNIPVSTLRKWEQGESRPADYVIALIAKTIPSDEDEIFEITGSNGEIYYCDESKMEVSDSKGNVIRIGESMEGVNRHNLQIYLEDLFDSFYRAQDRFDRDCMYDKIEKVTWSRSG